MSGEVAFLEIRVGGQGVTEARDRLRQLTEQSERAEKAAKKLADETERAAARESSAREKAAQKAQETEARKAVAAEKAAAISDRLATRAAINDGRMRQQITDAAAKYLARQEADEKKREARADKAATDAAIREGKAAQRRADEVAKYEAGEARKAAKVAEAARKQENTIQIAGQRQYAEVKKWLMTEEEALRESYLRRRSIIMSQGSGSMKQMDLAAMDYKYNQQLLTLRGSRLDSSKYAGTGPGMKAPSVFMGGASDAVTALAAGGGIQALTSTLIRFAPAAAAAAASYALVSKALGESNSYKQAIIQLSAAAGGAENAERAFSALDAMEEKIPIGAEEMAKAFTNLVNAGLNPSERSIRALAEVAVGTGSTLESVSEKTAQATMGNFRGLRELRIRAEEEGNRVKFTFRGVTTSVNNDSKSIQGYLTSLGETAFAGSLEKKMNSLEGSVFKLKDAWDDMFRDVGKNNIGPLIKEMVDIALASLTELRDLVSGSWVSKLFDGLTTGARSFTIEMRTAADIVAGVLSGDRKRIDAALALNEERHKALVIDEMSSENEEAFLAALKEQNLEIDKQGKIVQRRKDALAEFENTAKPKTRDKGAESDAKSAEKRRQEEFKRLEETMRSEEDVIAASHAKRQELIDRYAKGEKWFRMSAASLDEYGDKMEELRVKREKDVKEIEDSLRGEEEVIRETYARRIQIISSAVDDEARREKDLSLLSQHEAERRLKIEEENLKRKEELTRRKEDLFSPYRTEIENIRAIERRKLEEYKKARDEDLLSEQEYQFLKAKLHRETETKITENDMRNKEAIAGNSAALFGNLAQVSKNLGGEQSAAYRGLFAVSKAFSIAQATMSIATGAAKALELGWPAGLAAGIQVAAQGAGLLAQITSSNYSGAYDQGGIIPAGRIGIVGERGPEFVQGPAMVTGRQQTAQILNGQSQAGSGQVGRITIVNAPDTRGAYEFARSASGDRVFMNGVKRNASTIRQLLGVTG